MVSSSLHSCCLGFKSLSIAPGILSGLGRQGHFAALDSLVEARQAIAEEPVNPEEYITTMTDDQVREKARFAATADPLKNVESNTDIFQNSDDSDEVEYDADLLCASKPKGGLAKLTSGIKIPGFVTQPDKYTKYSLEKVDSLGRAANERIAVDFIYKLRGEQPPDAILPPSPDSFVPQYRRRAAERDTDMAMATEGSSEGVGVRMDNCRVMPEWTPFNQAQRRSRSRSSSQSRQPRRKLGEGESGEQQYSVEGKSLKGAISIPEEEEDDDDDEDDYSDMPGLMELDID